MGKTLEQIENEIWDEPEYDSYLVTTCHKLRKKPIDQFTVEDLRIMISQNIGLNHLLPLAVDVLRENPIAEGDFYQGDLLKAVIGCQSVQTNFGDVDAKELAQICMKAMTKLAIGEAEDLFWESSPEDYGLSHETIGQNKQARIDEIKQSTPYIEFEAFFKKHGTH